MRGSGSSHHSTKGRFRMKRLWMLLLLAATAFPVGASADQAKRPGWLGFAFTYHSEPSSDEASAEARGWLLVRDVIPQTPAHRAGILPDDMVIQMQGKPFRTEDVRGVFRALANIKPGENVAILVLRDGKRKTITVKAAPMPDPVWERWQKTLAMLAEQESRNQ